MPISHNLGFPHLGAARELKRATEGYWSGKVSLPDLLKTGAQLRARHWRLQQDAGIELIPSNDFSYYDRMLDTSALVGAVPKRYGRAGGAVDMDTDFAMARGGQAGGREGGGARRAMPRPRPHSPRAGGVPPRVSVSSGAGAQGEDPGRNVFRGAGRQLSDGARTAGRGPAPGCRALVQRLGKRREPARRAAPGVAGGRWERRPGSVARRDRWGQHLGGGPVRGASPARGRPGARPGG